MRCAEAWPFMKAAVQQARYGSRDPLPMNFYPSIQQAQRFPVPGSPHVIPEHVWGPIIGSSRSLHAPARAITNALPVRFSLLWFIVSLAGLAWPSVRVCTFSFSPIQSGAWNLDRERLVRV